MPKELLSVIVPVYNVEQYLKTCVDSLLSQTYMPIEIILVDDGSTDGSGILCDQYADNCHSVFTYHKKNGGLSSARNYGIKQAKGEIVGFVDSDDWADPEMFRKLMCDMKEENADISCCNYQNVYEGGDIIVRKTNWDPIEVYHGIEVLPRIYHEFCACNKIYKKDLFKDILFPEGKLYEDARTMYRLARIAKTATVRNEALYNYRQRSSGIMGSFSAKNYRDRVAVWNEIINAIGDELSMEDRIDMLSRKNDLVVDLLLSIAKQKKIKECADLVRWLSGELSTDSFVKSRMTLRKRITSAIARVFFARREME